MNIVGECLFNIKKNKSSDRDNNIKHYYNFSDKLFKEVEGLNIEEKENLIKNLNSQERGLLYGISTSGAIGSVIYSDPNRLVFGLKAIALLALYEDYREMIIKLTLLSHSARKLGVDFKKMFDEQNFELNDVAKTTFEYFFSEPRTLEQMHYKEGVDKNGDFTYIRQW